jgi:hypothetical protein
MSLLCRLPNELVIHVVCLYLEGADRAKLVDLDLVPFSVESVSWEDALCAGSLRLLKRLKASTLVNWSPSDCATSALLGHLEILKWARSQNCPWDVRTCAGAALNRHFETLKWARSQGCPWDDLTCIHAGLNGHIETVIWARSQGCPWDAWTCAYAARNG